MAKIEKFRKICKLVQNGGMALILLGGLFLVYWFGVRNQEETSLLVTVFYCMITIILLFTFMIIIVVPMQNKLLTMVILESVDGLITNVVFNRKKGYGKESFEKLGLVNNKFEKYGCVDYYSFNYKDMEIESTTVRAYDEYKIPKEKGKKGSKAGKKTVNYFYGRIYIVPFESEFKFNVFGKKNSSVSRKKEMCDTEYCNEYPLKIKKYNENFEVYYNDTKPTIDMNAFMDKLLTLKIQAKGPVSIFVRNKSFVLCIDNGRHYEEVDLKNKFDENIVRGYRKDISMVLNFINTLNKQNNK